MTIYEAREHEGSRVEYRAAGQPPEQGVITGAGLRFAYVRYDGGTAPKATDPAALTLLGGPR